MPWSTVVPGLPTTGQPALPRKTGQSLHFCAPALALTDLCALALTGDDAASSDSASLKSLEVLIKTLNLLGDEEWDRQITAARETFSDAIAEIGGQYFSYQIIRRPGIRAESSPQTEMITTYPGQWTCRYLENGYGNEHPVLAVAMRTTLPFSWRNVTNSAGLSPRQRQFFIDAKDAGFGESITLPVYDDHAVAAMNVTPFDRAGQALLAHSHLLYLMAHFFHYKVRRPLAEVTLRMSPRRRSLLSPRETEILEFAAKGMSTSQISSALKISKRSVEFHIEGAKQKLHVSNRTHAVAKGIMLGLLSICDDRAALRPL